LDFGAGPIKWPAIASSSISSVFQGTVGDTIADLNGDGLPDSLRGALVGFNYGLGFLSPENDGIAGSLGLAESCTTTEVDDINGDGFADQTAGEVEGVGGWLVYFGNGSTFNTNGVVFPIPTNAPESLPKSRLESSGAGGTYPAALLRDVTGDGLLDAVRPS